MGDDDVGWIKLAQDCQIFMNMMMHFRVRNFLTNWVISVLKMESGS
jgi:hypothetical protein